jgi:hypothetical protein
MDEEDTMACDCDQAGSSSCCVVAALDFPVERQLLAVVKGVVYAQLATLGMEFSRYLVRTCECATLVRS